eukprot:scaffold36686_cov229-Amphora_coffeaeformis.AAC.1
MGNRTAVGWVLGRVPVTSMALVAPLWANSSKTTCNGVVKASPRDSEDIRSRAPTGHCDCHHQWSCTRSIATFS